VRTLHITVGALLISGSFFLVAKGCSNMVKPPPEKIVRRTTETQTQRLRAFEPKGRIETEQLTRWFRLIVALLIIAATLAVLGKAYLSGAMQPRERRGERGAKGEWISNSTAEIKRLRQARNDREGKTQ
ncbi:hypothetical protein BVY02_02080, partial [bacterium J17]